MTPNNTVAKIKLSGTQAPHARSRENMTAFLKIDDCKTCRRVLPWEWIPAVVTGGKALAGTGVWRSQLLNGSCPSCRATLEAERQKEQNKQARQATLIELLGGEKPCREFTFERYQVTAGNRVGYERVRQFDPVVDNLYLWGPCGVGKTHLARAAARHCFEETLSVVVMPAFQLSRKVRMKDPMLEQAAISYLVGVDVLVLEDFGGGSDTAFTRQITQEILDGRDFEDRRGLIVTSAYSLGDLATKLGDDTIPSRLAGMCRIVEIRGTDRRIHQADIIS